VEQQRQATATVGTASRDGGPTGAGADTAIEADADHAATGAMAKLWGVAGDVVNGALSLPGRLREARPRLRRCSRSPSSDPLALALAPGQDTKTFSRTEYEELWEKKNGRSITGDERDTLKRGCIGITALNLQGGNTDPPLGLSFSTFDKALQVADALNAILRAKPEVDKLPDEASKHPVLNGLKNVISSFPPDLDPKEYKAVVFSKRFFSNQSPSWNARKTAVPGAFQPDPTTGQVDMSGYKYKAKVKPDGASSYTNFDYAWYDAQTDSWWHANHKEPGMKVYQSTLEHYSRPLLDFDRQVFSVAFARMP
jgi:hypothetical protein